MVNHNEPVTKEWLINLGMLDMGDGTLKSHVNIVGAPVAVKLQENSLDLGQLIDFYLYSPSKLVNIYSAYYLDRDDFLTDKIHQNIFWRRQSV